MSQRVVLKPSRVAYKLAEDAAIEELQSEKDNDLLKKSWLVLANQLHSENIPKHEISKLGKKIIIEKKKEYLRKINAPLVQINEVTLSGWWGEVMAEYGFTNQKHNTSIATAPSPENSSLKVTNQETIDILLKMKDIINLGIDKFQHMEQLETIYGEKETQEFYNQTNAFLDNCKDALDDKTKIPTVMQFTFIKLLVNAEAGLNNAVKLFYKTRLHLLFDQGNKLISTKQASKFLNGDKACNLPLLKHYDRETAVFGKCFGAQCKCGSYMVRSKSGDNHVECFDCENQFVADTISKCPNCHDLLLDPQIRHIIETHKCINCNIDIDLPQSVIDSVTA